MPIDVRTVFCDDIRREDNGKAILIGVYTGDLIPAVLPSKFPLSLWIDVRGLSKGQHKLKIDVSLPGGKNIGVEGQLAVDEPGQAVPMMLSGLPADITEPGIIEVVLEVDGAKVPGGQLIVRPAPSTPPQV